MAMAPNSTLVLHDHLGQLLALPVQCPQHVDAPVAEAGIGAVRLAQWRPAALYVGVAAHAGLVHEQQLDVSSLGRLLELVQSLAYALEFAGITLF
mgnify:CR=1 FL=1